MTQEKFLSEIRELCNRYIFESERNQEFTQFRDSYKRYTNLMRLANDCSVPPEYRRAGLQQEPISITPAGDVYSLMTYIFSLITQEKVPVNFQLGKKWKRPLEKACLGWDEAKKQALFKLFYNGTKINEKDRIHSIQDLMETEEYRELIDDKCITMSFR